MHWSVFAIVDYQEAAWAHFNMHMPTNIYFSTLHQQSTKKGHKGEPLSKPDFIPLSTRRKQNLLKLTCLLDVFCGF